MAQQGKDTAMLLAKQEREFATQVRAHEEKVELDKALLDEVQQKLNKEKVRRSCAALALASSL